MSRIRPLRALKKIARKIFISDKDEQEEESNEEMERKRRQGEELW